MSDTAIAKYATELQLDSGRFTDCVNGAKVSDKVKADLALAARLGIRSTPSFVLGQIRDGKVFPIQKITGAVSYDVFSKQIEQLRTQNSVRSLLGVGPFGWWGSTEMDGR
jgi:predicted DsbA family dithiol-disulfide isomerase